MEGDAMQNWLRATAMVVALGYADPVMADVWGDMNAAEARGDYATELRLLLPLAGMGNIDAQTVLGMMYEKGQGIQKDYSLAAKWYGPPAEQGHPLALTNLGKLYAEGKGVPKNYPFAAKLYLRAAEQGEARAQFLLAGMYSSGTGVPKDWVFAYMWANLSAASGFEFAPKLRDLAASQMTPAQIAEAQRLAREWKPKPVK